MKPALDQFQVNLIRARGLTTTADSLRALTTPAIDLSDVYRASLVLGVSALDYFVHEFVRLGMIEVHRGNRPATDAYLIFKVPLAKVRVGIANTAEDDWLDKSIRDAHSWKAFQRPDEIADAVRLICGAKLWEGVANKIGSDAKAVKARLDMIVERRNKIAHEADMDPTNPGLQWPIDGVLVRDALDYIEHVAEGIYAVAA
jgi:hypothetical protein